jgi:hypothetical protein
MPDSTVRTGGARLSLRNSGREVWLYDDANRAAIRAAGPGMGGAPARIPELTRAGLLLGVSLQQDDDLEVEVIVGAPLTSSELAAARWLEPQTALLRLPSGKLSVEPNDSSRIGPEPPTEKGGVVAVPPGDYRVTLYRIDHEALFREGLTWKGPGEVVVFTPGGTAADAADDLLPFQERRDTDWVGKYTIDGQRAEALAWFNDYWDTFTLNLDSAAIAKLRLVPGSYLQTTVPAAGLTLITTFAGSWDKAMGFPPPEGVELSEYGYAAVLRMDEWNGAEALFCRRETATARVEHQHHGVWTPAVVEVLHATPKVLEGRGFVATDLGAKTWFDDGFLAMVLSEVLPEVADLDELPLPEALGRLDKKLAKMDLRPQGDVSWQERNRMQVSEMCCRLYTGRPDCFAAILAGDGTFEVIFLSELDDATWVVTGLADELPRRVMKKGPNGLPVPHPRVQLENMDESLAKIAAAHKTAVRKSKRKTAPAPASRAECLDAFGRFLAVALG